MYLVKPYSKHWIAYISSAFNNLTLKKTNTPLEDDCLDCDKLLFVSNESHVSKIIEEGCDHSSFSVPLTLSPDGSRFVNMQFVLSTLQQHKPCCFVQLTLWLRPSPSVSFAFLWRIFTIIKKHYRGHDKQLCKVLLSCIYSAARINTKWLLFENQKDTLLDQTAELYQLEMYIKTIRKWFKALKIISTKQQLIQALLFVIH